MRNIIMILLLCSCAVSKTKLTKEGKKVNVTFQKPRKKCTPHSSVVGENDNGIKELAINHATNLAAEEGANTLFVKETVNEGKSWKVYGIGYDCR